MYLYWSIEPGYCFALKVDLADRISSICRLTVCSPQGGCSAHADRRLAPASLPYDIRRSAAHRDAEKFERYEVQGLSLTGSLAGCPAATRLSAFDSQFCSRILMGFGKWKRRVGNPPPQMINRITLGPLYRNPAIFQMSANMN